MVDIKNPTLLQGNHGNTAWWLSYGWSAAVTWLHSWWRDEILHWPSVEGLIVSLMVS